LSRNLKILVAESSGFSPKAVAILRELGEVELGDLDFDQLWALAPEFDVLWVRLRHRIDSALLDHAPRLRSIATPTTGLVHIDMDGAAKRGVKVFSLRGETEFLKDVRATAEHTIALMLALLRKIPAAIASVREGDWKRDRFKGGELYEKTVGIVGYGRVGQIVGKYLRAFGAKVLVTDPRLDPHSSLEDTEIVSLKELLRRADLVTVHVDLRMETTNFLGWDEFRSMKPGAWFVNTSRGELIVEEALLEALQSGHLAGAALDVLKEEIGNQAAKSGLACYGREHDGLLITPHIGGCTFESMEKTEIFLAKKLRSALGAGAECVTSPASQVAVV
jgi:D-3-phosphoglycerate dehydrogenase